jgi:hypothetical protein
MAILNNNPLIGASGQSKGYRIERSLRFNSDDSAYLDRTLGTPTNGKIFTFSVWLKRSTLSTLQSIMTAKSGGNEDSFAFLSGDTLRLFFSAYSSSGLTTNAVFRDVSAWYHIVLAVDTTQATASNRVKMYVNGVEQTFTGSNYPSQNATPFFNTALQHFIGRYANQPMPAGNFNGYMTEINFIDGQALTPSSFGQTNSATGVWEPKAYSGSYGTNGFYLKFADNSGTTSTTLGKDSSGNSNNWTPNGFLLTPPKDNDSLVDSPTQYGTDTGAGGEVRGNYATLSAIASSFGFSSSGTPTISNGNLTAVSSAQNQHQFTAPFGLSSGKWYWEITLNSTPTELEIGVTGEPFTDNNSPFATGEGAKSWTAFPYGASGQVYNNNVAASGTFIASAVSGDVLRIAVDMDNGKIFWGKNGTWTNSADPAAGTGFSHSNLSGTVVPAFGQSGNGYSYNFDVNFGQRPFAYTAPSGFKALCTTNLPTPTIGATATTRADDYFNAVLYTGDGTSNRAITGVGFSPDLVWFKSRNNAYRPVLLDSVRGGTKILYSDGSEAEITSSGGITSFDSDGFTVSPDTTNANSLNTNTATIVAWNWRGSDSSAVSNTQGTITSTVSANTTAGFSIVTYTGTGSAATVGHGLGATPSMIILKNRGAAHGWPIYHTTLGADAYLYLNRTDASATYGGIWNGGPTSTIFGLPAVFDQWNANGNTYVAYCFAPIAGFSAFGSYTGNGSTDGPFIYTGFRPRYLLQKGSDVLRGWNIWDTARSPYNVVDSLIQANSSGAESTGGYNSFDLLSNGFKVRSADANWNNSGSPYIFMAFAENPFKYSLAR